MKSAIFSPSADMIPRFLTTNKVHRRDRRRPGTNAEEWFWTVVVGPDQ
jgi:hypothetical protein